MSCNHPPSLWGEDEFQHPRMGAGSANHLVPSFTKTSREAAGHLSCARPSARTQSRHCNNHNSSCQHLLSSEGLPGPSAKCITRIIPLNSHSNQHRNRLVLIPLGR